MDVLHTLGLTPDGFIIAALLALCFGALVEGARALQRIAVELARANQRPAARPVITLDSDSIDALAEATAREADHYRLYGSRS